MTVRIFIEKTGAVFQKKHKRAKISAQFYLKEKRIDTLVVQTAIFLTHLLQFNTHCLPVRHLEFGKETADHRLVQSAHEAFPPLVLRLGRGTGDTAREGLGGGGGVDAQARAVTCS